MIHEFPTADPDDYQRYYWDFTEWLDVVDGGTIDQFEIVLDGGLDNALGIAYPAQGTGAWAGWLMVWLGPGTLDANYVVRARVTLTDGTSIDQSCILPIETH